MRRGLWRSGFWRWGACLALMAGLMTEGLAQEPPHFVPAPTLPTIEAKPVIYQGQPHEALYQESRYLRELVFNDGTTIKNEMLKRELLWTSEDGGTRTIWVETTPWSPGSGGPVTDVAVWQREAATTLILALTNTYDPGKRIVEIDPATTAAEIAERRVQLQDGGWDPAPPAAHALLDVTTDGHLDRQIGGTREVRVSASGNLLTLDVEPIDSPPRRLTFDTETETWAVLPEP